MTEEVYIVNPDSMLTDPSIRIDGILSRPTTYHKDLPTAPCERGEHGKVLTTDHQIIHAPRVDLHGRCSGLDLRQPGATSDFSRLQTAHDKLVSLFHSSDLFYLVTKHKVFPDMTLQDLKIDSLQQGAEGFDVQATFVEWRTAEMHEEQGPLPPSESTPPPAASGGDAEAASDDAESTQDEKDEGTQDTPPADSQEDEDCSTLYGMFYG